MTSASDLEFSHNCSLKDGKIAILELINNVTFPGMGSNLPPYDHKSTRNH